MSSEPKIITYTNGRWRQNCYVIYNRLLEAIIIDPGTGSLEIEGLIKEENLKPLAIINTHAHYDHVGAVWGLKKSFEIPFYLHSHDKKLLSQANLYRTIFSSSELIKIPTVDYEICQSSHKFKIGMFDIIAYVTPGHTAGSVCIQIGNSLFSGDTLLPNGPGRVDLPGANSQQMKDSLSYLASLDAELIIYPGHGEPFLKKNCEYL